MLKRWKTFYILVLCCLLFTLFLPRIARANSEGIGIVIASLFGLLILNEATRPHHVYGYRHHSAPVTTFRIHTERYNPTGWCRQVKYIYENGYEVRTLIRDIHCPRSHFRNWRRHRRHRRYGNRW